MMFMGEVLEYLQNPTSEGPALISFLQDSNWPLPLEEEASNSLLLLLTNSAEESETPTPETAIIEPESEKTVAPEPEKNFQTLEVAVDGKIFLGPPDYVEMLLGEIESAKTDLVTKLNKFITLNTTDSALVEEASKDYTDHVRRLYEVVEMLGLEGLQTVCTFVADNVAALIATDAEIRLKAKKVLNPRKFASSVRIRVLFLVVVLK